MGVVIKLGIFCGHHKRIITPNGVNGNESVWKTKNKDYHVSEL